MIKKGDNMGLKALSINEVKQVATNRGGWCLSQKYFNQLTKLKWKCSEGHIWGAIPKNVKKIMVSNLFKYENENDCLKVFLLELKKE